MKICEKRNPPGYDADWVFCDNWDKLEDMRIELEKELESFPDPYQTDIPYYYKEW